MAIGWMTILSNVPWSDVIKNAPAVVDGAKKLWKKTANRASTAEGAVPASNATGAERLLVLEGRISELQAQMLASSEVIQSLAEQNAQLIARVEKTRRRLLLLALANVAALVYLLAA